MPFRQIAALAITGLFIVGIGVRVYGLAKERNAAVSDFRTLQDKNRVVEQDQARIEGEAQFLANPDNLEKELRARLNYHAPDQHEIIIVSPQSSSSTSTASGTTSTGH